MLKKKTPKEVYEELLRKDQYEETVMDKDDIVKVITLAIEDYTYGKKLRSDKDANYRVIFNIHYDALRELCDQLMRFEKQKTSNHQGLFAFIVLNFPDLELDWNFFESIRTIRNQNKYQGRDITKEMWKQVELQFDIYISSLKKEIEQKLKK